uniref:Uncharacterized protein n=1 Tax=Vannella robusta TaxID=1487602 RepID=A0A7S4MM04_9EUKA|mmetsp:Transcript_3195/g.3937  ORF Transcript_3195/g.3937 Transcript_3195/m.3937 type:complete len:246 (+) Transcript_3195:1-738(+)
MNAGKFVVCSSSTVVPAPRNQPAGVIEHIEDISGFSDTDSPPKAKQRHSRRKSRSKHTETRKQRISSSTRSIKKVKQKRKRKQVEKKPKTPRYVANTLYGDADPFAFSPGDLDKLFTVKKEKIQEEREIQVSPSSSQCEYEYYRFRPDSSQKLVPVDNSESSQEQYLSQSDIKSSPLFNTSQDLSESPTKPLPGVSISNFKVKKDTSTCSTDKSSNIQAQGPNKSSVKRFTIPSAMRESSLTSLH